MKKKPAPKRLPTHFEQIPVTAVKKAFAKVTLQSPDEKSEPYSVAGDALRNKGL